MDKIVSALNEFEERNNISATVKVYSDGSFGVEEFWTEDDLGNFETIEELLQFLAETQYKVDENGKCLRPFQMS